jgi:hypothetical protein
MFHRRLNSKNICIISFSIIVAINLIFFVRRLAFSDYSNADEILKVRHHLNVIAVDSTQQHVNDPCFQPAVAATTSAAESSSTSAATATHQLMWCSYESEVDLRIIVLTYNRQESLLRLLSSVSDLEMDGDSVAVEIWIDRDKNDNVDEQTLASARSFRWRYGNVSVHVHAHHVGIYGQWINTWRPRSASSKEIGLFLEDDVSVSPFAYRWLRQARRFYAGRSDIAGFTLQSESLIVAATGRALPTKVLLASDGAAFLYEPMGSWGFAPRPDVWIGFQDWFAQVRSRSSTASVQPFHPYVPGIVMTRWYRDFEKKGRADSMWTIWFIYYCSNVRSGLYTVYSNIGRIAGNSTNGQGTCLAVNRREPGLHFSGKPIDNTKQLLRTWKEEFVRFSSTPAMLSFKGHRIKAKTTGAT